MKRIKYLFCLLVFTCSTILTVTAQSPPSEEKQAEEKKSGKHDIMDGPRNTFTVEPFSPLFAYLMVGYEKGLSRRIGLEFSFGIAGLGLDHYPLTRLTDRGHFKPVIWGGIFKGGPKIKLFNKNARNTLQGFYLKPELVMSFYRQNTSPFAGIAVMANVGYQHIFFKRLSLSAFGGFGLGDHFKLTTGRQFSGGIETGFVDIERGWNIDIVLNAGVKVGVAF